LTLLAAVNVENRPILRLRKEGSPLIQTIPLATFEDLKETLSLIQYGNGVRPYILEWYYDVFLPTFENKTERDSKFRGSIEMIESRIALTSQQLADATFTIKNKKLSTRQIRETYIEQLINEGYIDTEKSELNKSADIYFPVITTKLSGEVEKYAVFDQSPPKTDSLRINVKNPSLFPRKNYMVSKIESVLQVETGTLVTNDINVEELVDKYYKNPEEYFIVSSDIDNSVAMSTDRNTTANGVQIEPGLVNGVEKSGDNLKTTHFSTRSLEDVPMETWNNQPVTEADK